MKIVKTIQKEIQKSPQSQYVISMKTGLNKSILCRIMRQKNKTISSDVADRLLNYFGYKLVKAKKGR